MDIFLNREREKKKQSQMSLKKLYLIKVEKHRRNDVRMSHSGENVKLGNSLLLVFSFPFFLFFLFKNERRHFFLHTQMQH